MNHTPVVIDTIIEYYDFKMNGMEGPQQYPTIHLSSYSGEQINERIKENKNNHYSLKSVTPIHQGVLDYMGDNMSVGGTNPTCGIIVHWEQTCCGAMQVWEYLLKTNDENRKNPNQWCGWASALRTCGDLKHATAILKTAESRFSGNALILYYLACYSCLQDDFNSANHYLKKAIAIDNQYEEMAKNEIDLFPLFISDI
jgi:hypothetical protein